MNFLYKVSVIVLLVISSFTFSIKEITAGELSNEINCILAKVGGELITSYDLDKKITFILLSRGLNRAALSSDDFAKIKTEAIDSLISDRIIQLELRRADISFTEREINNEIADMAARNNYETAKITEYFRIHGVEREYRDFINGQLFLREFIHSAIKSKIYVSDKEIEENLYIGQKLKEAKIKELEKIIAASADKKNNNIREWDSVNIAQLSASLDSANEVQEANIDKLKKDIEKDIKTNMDFDNLLKKYSNNNESNRGNLGWFKVSDLSTEYINALEGAKIGEFSKPIVSGNTVTFLMLLDVKLFPTIDQGNLQKAKKLLAELRSSKDDSTFLKANVKDLLLDTKLKIHINNYINTMSKTYLIQTFM